MKGIKAGDCELFDKGSIANDYDTLSAQVMLRHCREAKLSLVQKVKCVLISKPDPYAFT